MKFKKGYLAHPFDTRKAIRFWEQNFEKSTGIELVNPFYDLERTDVEAIDQKRAERYEKLDAITLVERDLTAIYSCDFVVAFVTGALSYGTIQEIVYAYLAGKSVFIIVTNGHEGHPWLRYHSSLATGGIFTKASDFEKFITEQNNDSTD